jgi:predicted RNase H-like HicB family nuclease
MLRDYIKAAMGKAHYEILSDDGTLYGEIPGFQGVWANAETLEACRDELEEVLEEWVLFRVSRNLELPVVDGLCLSIKEAVS